MRTKPEIPKQKAYRHHDMRYKARRAMSKINNKKLLSFPAVIFIVAILSSVKAEGK